MPIVGSSRAAWRIRPGALFPGAALFLGLIAADVDVDVDVDEGVITYEADRRNVESILKAMGLASKSKG